MSISALTHREQRGFTLIELLVVISIIALLSSVALIAVQQARMKSRNVKRLSDMTQMASVMELYFNTNRGYPSGTSGMPQGMTPGFLAALPTAPMPADGDCAYWTNPAGGPANAYYYVPSGTPSNIGGLTLYPDYTYYFCLGDTTGNFPPGQHTLTPKGLR